MQQDYLTLSEVEKAIRDNKFPCFKLFIQSNETYREWNIIKTYVSEGYEKKGKDEDEEAIAKLVPASIVNETIETLNINLNNFKGKLGYIFKVEFRYSAGSKAYGPFIFKLEELNPISKGLNGNQISDFRSSDDYIDFRIAKANHERDVREFYIKRAELDEETKEFETKKINPAAQVAAKGALYAWDVFSKHVLKIDSSLSGIPIKDENEPSDVTGRTDGTEDEDTEAASSFANDLISSGLSADQIKELHRIAKESLIPKMKPNGNKDQETD